MITLLQLFSSPIPLSTVTYLFKLSLCLSLIISLILIIHFFTFRNERKELDPPIKPENDTRRPMGSRKGSLSNLETIMESSFEDLPMSKRTDVKGNHVTETSVDITTDTQSLTRSTSIEKQRLIYHESSNRGKATEPLRRKKELMRVYKLQDSLSSCGGRLTESFEDLTMSSFVKFGVE